MCARFNLVDRPQSLEPVWMDLERKPDGKIAPSLPNSRLRALGEPLKQRRPS
jgi:hypothetical protein